MSDRTKQKDNPSAPAEYAVIGAGPAGICAVAKLYGTGIPGDKIIWIDPQFKVGDFGTLFSAGSSVPGNTTVASYQKVNRAIYAMIPACAPTVAEENNFAITSLSSDVTCPLKIAAQPLQHITNHLRVLVGSIEGSVSAIQETPEGMQIEIKHTHGSISSLAKRVILAIGAKPKTMALPSDLTIIDPHIAFIESELKQYLNKHSEIKTVAVIGSSHSAALAAMHLLQAGIVVKQFMNKEYKFATPSTTADGKPYTQFDNTGLKGNVATFTRQLLNNESMRENWEYHIGTHTEDSLATHLADCTHAVACIGYTPVSSLKINGLPLESFNYCTQSTKMLGEHGRPIPGLFGIGVAFPPKVQAISGELEFAVGVGKFWASLKEKTLAEWQACRRQS